MEEDVLFEKEYKQREDYSYNYYIENLLKLIIYISYKNTFNFCHIVKNRKLRK